jgi:hypothetical protein
MAGNREDSTPSPQSRNDRHYSRNGCERVLIFGSHETPSTSVCGRGGRRARLIGGLRAPIAAETAPLWDQVGFRLGHIPGRPGSVQAAAPAPRTASQSGRRCEQGVARGHPRRENSRRNKSTAQTAAASSFSAATRPPTRAVALKAGLGESLAKDKRAARRFRLFSSKYVTGWGAVRCGHHTPSTVECMAEKNARFLSPSP